MVVADPTQAAEGGIAHAVATVLDVPGQLAAEIITGVDLGPAARPGECLVS
jgi:hypothetical protein